MSARALAYVMPLGIATAPVASLLFNGTSTQFLAIAVSLIVVMCAITLLIALAHVAMALHQLVLLKIEPHATFLNRLSLAAFLGTVALVMCAYFLIWPANGAAIKCRPWIPGGAVIPETG